MGGVSHKWMKIGIQLGISQHKLKEFRAEDDDPFVNIMDYWLKGNVAESFGSISWKSIVAALESTHVGEPALAKEIREKYWR